ncbi:acetoacetate decarboxylase family protein [Temperatibacter marinus]|uniref:Acetoacetate decarboxylase family protein n=1 Tax=Temperatibacter marinus TaxID=1456591 RepID=A0AA52EHR2_9PROT|nr:acetoacetate decarboxylase family protein [Temperatibacter marinus]WND03010.1 acetoacetate decarboxylase family protein [Temperatibacter marinus]
MFKFQSLMSYMMPAHFGPRYAGPGTSGWYRDVTTMVIPYVTDREKLAAYLPEHFEVAEEAVITVYFACNKQIDWLAGRGYNMIGVNANVIYKGKEETLEGTYSLVIWENLTDPILTGREMQGIPKIYADIPDHAISQNRWTTNASHFGNKIIDLSLSNLRAPSLDEIAFMHQKSQGKDTPMGWRFLQNAGKEGVSEYTTFPSENHFKQVMLGEGSVKWNQLSWEENPTQYQIVNALADLPILEYRPALMTKGATNLLVPENMPRALK